MKRHLPLIISACIATTLTTFFLEWESQHEPLPAAYNDANDLPATIMMALIITSFCYGFFIIANRVIAHFKHKSHEFTNFL